MSQTVIADFVGQIRPDGAKDFTEGRVLLSPTKLLLVSGSTREQIDLESILGIAMSDVDPGLQHFFDAALAVEYRKDGTCCRTWVQAKPETLRRFRKVFFKALFKGETLTLWHPASVGGRIYRPNGKKSKATFAQGETRFTGPTETRCTIDHDHLVRVVPGNRMLQRAGMPNLSVVHTSNGGVKTSVVGSEHKRLLNLLKCYFEVHIQHDREEIQELALEPPAVRVLLWLYAGGSPKTIPRALPGDTPPKPVISHLHEHRLVQKQSDTITLTRRGLAAADHYYVTQGDSIE